MRLHINPLQQPTAIGNPPDLDASRASRESGVVGWWLPLKSKRLVHNTYGDLHERALH